MKMPCKLCLIFPICSSRIRLRIEELKGLYPSTVLLMLPGECHYIRKYLGIDDSDRVIKYTRTSMNKLLKVMGVWKLEQERRKMEFKITVHQKKENKNDPGKTRNRQVGKIPGL